MARNRLRARQEYIFAALVVVGVLASVFGAVFGKTILLEVGIPGTLGIVLGRLLTRIQRTRDQVRGGPRTARTRKLELIALMLLVSVELVNFRVSGFGWTLLMVSALVWICILSMILTEGSREAVVVSVIVAQSLLARAFVFYSLESVVGVDPWFHLNASADIIQNGHVLTPGLYFFYPLYHVGLAVISQLSGLTLRESSFAFGAVSESLIGVFLYLVGRKVGFGRAGLAGAWAVGFLPWTLKWGFWLIPMSVGMLFLAELLFFWVGQGARRGSGLVSRILATVLLLPLILIHPLAAFASVVVMVGFVLNQMIRFSKERIVAVHFVSYGATMLAIVALVGYWVLISGSLQSLLYSMTRNLSIDLAGDLPLGGPSLNASLIYVVNRIPLHILIFSTAAVFAVGSVIDSKYFLRALCIGGVLIATLSFVGVVLQNPEVLPDRWVVFAALALALPLGAFLIVLWQNTGGNRVTHRAVRGLAVCIACVLVACSSVNYLTRVEPIFPWDDQAAVGFSAQEVGAADFFSSKGAVLYVDTLYRILFSNATANSAADASDILFGNASWTGVLLFRQSIVGFLAPARLRGSLVSKYVPDTIADILKSRGNVIYDSGKVIAIWSE
jgi:hypothetical protein